MSNNVAATVAASRSSSGILSPKIAIIGSGAAGLVAARVLSRQQQQQKNRKVGITVLEKDEDVAGVWNYREQQSRTRPMYKGLRTNLPKEIMAYRELPWPEADRSFVTHEEVAHYLHQYCHHFDLEQYIQTGCRVEQLTCLPDTTSQFSPSIEVWPKIRLHWTDTNTDLTCSEDFDAICVCNGHYSSPAFPNIPGLDEYFQGTALHSIAYDVPEAFEGQTVLCIGGRASGSDIAREIATMAGTTVYLSDTAFAAAEPIQHNNVTWVPKTIELLPDGRVVFAKTSTGRVTDPVRVDTIIFCSGYDYNFPFINDKSNLELEVANRRVRPVFSQLWHAEYPNIAFVGLPHSILPFPLFELQVEAIERSWRTAGDDDFCILPCLDERRLAADADACSGGEGKPENGRVPEDTHYLGSAQWDYCRRMAEYAGIQNGELENFLSTNKVGAELNDHPLKLRWICLLWYCLD